MSEDELISIVQAAEEIGVPKETLRSAIRHKKLTATKQGRDWYVTRQDVQHWQTTPEYHQAGRKRRSIS